jgi:hypothetical protein
MGGMPMPLPGTDRRARGEEARPAYFFEVFSERAIFRCS